MGEGGGERGVERGVERERERERQRDGGREEGRVSVIHIKPYGSIYMYFTVEGIIQ